jgi:threonine dehydratase
LLLKGANAMAISLARGRRTTLAKVDAFADGVAVKTVRESVCLHSAVSGRLQADCYSTTCRSHPSARKRSADQWLQVGQETFRVCRELVEGIVLVNNAAISGAIRDVYAETRTVLEPAGALAVAGARAYLQRHDCKVGTSLQGGAASRMLALGLCFRQHRCGTATDYVSWFAGQGVSVCSHVG